MAGRKTQDPRPKGIEQRANELYIERGGDDGHDVDDWIQAERELMGTQREKSQLDPEFGSQSEPRRTVERSGERTSERISGELSADRSSLSDSLNSTTGKQL